MSGREAENSLPLRRYSQNVSAQVGEAVFPFPVLYSELRTFVRRDSHPRPQDSYGMYASRVRARRQFCKLPASHGSKKLFGHMPELNQLPNPYKGFALPDELICTLLPSGREVENSFAVRPSFRKGLPWLPSRSARSQQRAGRKSRLFATPPRWWGRQDSNLLVWFYGPNFSVCMLRPSGRVAAFLLPMRGSHGKPWRPGTYFSAPRRSRKLVSLVALCL